MSIADKLLQLNQVKQDIKKALENKGVDLTGVDFGRYAEKIHEIPTVVELTQAQYDALSESKTWLINETLNNESVYVTDISFTSNGQTFNILNSEYVSAANAIVLYYNDTPTYSGSWGVWVDEAYRTITFETAPSGALLAWLEANAVKQTDEGYDNNTYYLIVEEE